MVGRSAAHARGQVVSGRGRFDYSNWQVERIIDEWIHSSRDREMLKARLIDGLTYGRIEEEFGLSSSQVKRIIRRGMGIIIRHLPPD